METKMEKVRGWGNFSEICRSFLETLFEIQGTVRNPILVFEHEGVIIIRYLSFEEEGEVEKLHAKLLYTIIDLIRRLALSELFVGYEGFYVMEEGAVRVLVGTLYSDDEEQVWLAQTHGGTVGEWQDISDNQSRCGFEGLFKKAKAYLRN
jgi:hypothetical protein